MPLMAVIISLILVIVVASAVLVADMAATFRFPRAFVWIKHKDVS